MQNFTNEQVLALKDLILFLQKLFKFQGCLLPPLNFITLYPFGLSVIRAWRLFRFALIYPFQSYFFFTNIIIRLVFNLISSFESNSGCQP